MGKGNRGQGTRGRGSDTVNKGQPRVYVLMHYDAQGNNAVVVGILSVCSLNAHALIDLGSTHSYLSVYFLSRLRGLLKPLDQLF